MSKQLLKKKELPIAQIKILFQHLISYISKWIQSPTFFVIALFNCFDSIIIVLGYLILLGQTARLFIKERSYANTKAVMVKWIIFLFFEFILAQISKDSIQGALLKSVFFMAILVLIYPSQISKSIFQKCLKGQQFLKQSSPMTDSFVVNNDSLIEKLLVVILVSFLKATKFGIIFVNPFHRKIIETQVSQINQILQDEKYFWKVDANQQMKPRQKQALKIPTKEPIKLSMPQDTALPAPPKISMSPPVLIHQPKQNFQEMIEKELTKGIIQVMDLEKQYTNDFSTVEQVYKTDTINTTFSRNKNQQNLLSQSTPLTQQSSANQSVVFKQKKYKKYAVSQYLPLFSTTNKSSTFSNLPNKRCTYYREIEISYDVSSAVMTVTSLEDMKVSYHSLQQIVLLQELMVQFEFEQSEQMMVKFKNRGQYEEFISSIDMYQSGFHNK